MLKIRLFRPLWSSTFQRNPQSVKRIAVLDRTKEPGSAGEPLYQMSSPPSTKRSLMQAPRPTHRIIGALWALFQRAHASHGQRCLDELKSQPQKSLHHRHLRRLTHSSLDFDPSFDIEPDDVVRALFWGLGSDGTVSANKNSIKIIGEETSNFAQGYFVYDSKKAGARTISHLRFGPQPIKSSYLISRANFVAVHQFGFLQVYDVLEAAQEGAVFLLNAPYKPDRVWAQLPRDARTDHRQEAQFYVIDAYKVAQDLAWADASTPSCRPRFFGLLEQAVSSDAKLLRDEAIAQIKYAIAKLWQRAKQSCKRILLQWTPRWKTLQRRRLPQ